MPKIRYDALSAEQVQSTRRLKKIAFLVFLAALVVVVMAWLLASGEVFGFGVRDAIGGELLSRLPFGSAIAGMIALEVFFYCLRRLYIHDAVSKGEFPGAMNGMYVMLMMFLAFFIILVVRNFQNRWAE